MKARCHLESRTCIETVVKTLEDSIHHAEKDAMRVDGTVLDTIWKLR